MAKNALIHQQHIFTQRKNGKTNYPLLQLSQWFLFALCSLLISNNRPQKISIILSPRAILKFSNFLKNRNYRLKLGLIVLVILVSQPLYAGNPKTFTVGVQDFAEYRPYSHVNNGDYGGFNRELLDFFARTNGYRFEYRPYPLKRLIRKFLDGQTDFKYPDNPYWSADLKKGKQVIYSAAVVEYIDGVMVLPKNKGRGEKQLKTLGVVAGFTPLVYLNRVKTGALRVREVFGYAKLLGQTLNATVGGAYSNIHVSQYYLKNVLKRPGALVFDDSLPHTKSHRHLSSIKYPNIIVEFDQFLLKNQTKIQALRKKYHLE